MKRLATKLTLSMLIVAVALVSQAFSRDDGGDIIYTEPVMGVIFSHEVHVDDNGFACEDCHDDPFEMEALAAQEDPNFTMKGLEEGLYCGMCHDGDTAFASDTQCATCHIGVKGYRRATGEAPSGAHH
jgi:c(7)-type cytochrome triheme protein